MTASRQDSSSTADEAFKDAKGERRYEVKRRKIKKKKREAL